jgi:homoserine dehydrogenase
MIAPMAKDPTRPDGVHVALLGFGTVGGSVERLLRLRADDVARVAGQPVLVTRALVRDAARPRTPAPPPGLLTTRFEDVLEDPRITVVAEVMGSIEPTRDYVRRMLEAGKSVVSANKQLLARHGEELFALAEQHRAQLRFEASVCAAIPVVKVLRESMMAAGVRELLGIVNGTTNFILTAMSREGATYGDALRRAQELGYAEADPTEDVGGGDAAAKLAILTSIAFHRHVRLDDVPYEGIDRLEAADVAFAQELGYAVKLLARASLGPDGIAARVAPMLVPRDHPLARVEGSFNAVMLRGDAIREITLQGPGAGGDETASAVIGDLLGIIATAGSGHVPSDGYYRSLPIVPPEQVVSALYVRLAADDRPGVLAQIAGAFGRHGVSIESMIQRPLAGGAAELALLTHPAPEGSAFAAIDEVAALDLCRSTPHVLRVLSGE